MTAHTRYDIVAYPSKAYAHAQICSTHHGAELMFSI